MGLERCAAFLTTAANQLSALTGENQVQQRIIDLMDDVGCLSGRAYTPSENRWRDRLTNRTAECVDGFVDGWVGRRME